MPAASPKPAKTVTAPAPVQIVGRRMDALAVALASKPRLLKIYDSMPPSHQREYNTWIASTKKPETQQARVAKALKMIAEWEKKKAKK
jgi:uncharacterized protein YdeI (YjbR/CyaY-like superfamily)